MKPCARKRAQQALCDALLEVQMHRVLGEHARILEDDRPDRCLPAPVGELLVLLAGRTKRVQGGGPAQVGLGAAVERREAPYRVALLVPVLPEGFGAEEFEGTRECLPERRRLEPDPLAGHFQQALATLDLGLQFLLTFAGRFEFLVGDALRLCVEVCLLNRSRELLGIAVADALPETALDVIVDHLREATELFLDGLSLS